MIAPADVLGLCVLVASVLLCWWRLRTSPWETAAPFVLFSAAYIVTTVLGAVVLRLAPGLLAPSLVLRGIDPTSVPEVPVGRFWLLLCAPLLSVGVVGPPRESAAAAEAESATSSLGEVVAVGTAVSLVLVGFFVGSGLSVNPLTVFSVQGDYTGSIVARYAVFAALPRSVLGLLYVALPCVIALSFQRFFQTRRAGWALTGWGLSIVCVWLSLLTFQKSLVLVAALIVMFAVSVERRLHLRVVVGAGAIGLLVLAGMQWFVLGDLSVAASGLHALMRMATGVPYYAGLYPDVLPFHGVSLDGVLVGRSLFSPAPDYNVLVFLRMYDATALGGSAPIGATFSAYAEAGVAYALLISMAVAVYMRVGLGLILPFRRSSTGFVLLTVLLMQSYYVTQVPLSGITWSSYGGVWALVVLCPLALLAASRPRDSRGVTSASGRATSSYSLGAER